MILLDNRIGSGDLTTFFAKWNVKHQLCRLEYGDAAFDGNGPSGSKIKVAVEIKKVRDALACMVGGRFAAHQLPGLLQNYQKVWLVVEGQYSTDYQDGLLMERRGKHMVPIALGQRRFMYRDFTNWLTTMEVKTGVKVRRTASRLETARFITCLHSWWTQKEWEDHRAHLAIQEDGLDGGILLQPNLVRRLAAQLPGVGFTRSAAVARHFKTPLEMFCASVSEWQNIPGIGRGTAEKVQRVLVNGE